MAYPPPPGIPNINSNSHPSLPARPPPSKAASGFKPAFRPATSAAPPFSTAPSYPGAPATSSQYGAAAYPSYSQSPVNALHYQSQPQSYQYPQSSYQQNSNGAPPSGTSYGAPPAPQIRNPFPVPGTNSDYDPEMAAQIAQWQSAYVSKDPTRDIAPTVRNPAGAASATTPAAIAQAPETEAMKAEKKKTVVREGGGKKWTDDTLLEWDPSHLRLFVGNLAGEVTDESLLKAFSRWKSVQKARVIRDKRTTKSKGFGFVSFSDADDFFQAAKEMNGKYIQSHPVVVRKANTEIKVTNVKEKDRGKKHKNKSGNGNKQSETAYESHLGPVHHGGIHKAGQKTKNGLRLLG